ncbi:sensor histidine kinase [Halobacterium wangiae]|uniref:sensor histidine kinase n=1 Tax=Halobacterium wangiae TaxID=2902623 RepID=UPI001E2D763B|nr:ATP-binding protein [Halobacterium wangiae]
MNAWERSVSAVGGRRLVGALGALYVVLAVGWVLTQDLGDPLLDELIVFLLVAGPGFVILYGGSRLDRFQVNPEFYPTVVAWCFGGLVVMLAVLGFYSLQPGEQVDEPSVVLILTGLASLAGLATGIYNAQARTRASELEDAVEQLAASNERLEQFAYAASHDLQEPLRMVSSYLQLIENRYGDDLDEDAEEFIEYAVDGADRMRTMIESLLEYSRVTTEGGAFEPTDTNAVLEDVLTDLQLRVEETDATVTVDDLPTVPADSDQLAQVFQNLLSNALRYSGDEPPRIHVSGERTGDTWRFAVADEGVGIAAEHQDRIFTVFEQVHGHGAGEAGESGIGLAMCERIVERHGGDIWVESDSGEGATFYFTIPATVDPTPAAGVP